MINLICWSGWNFFDSKSWFFFEILWVIFYRIYFLVLIFLNGFLYLKLLIRFHFSQIILRFWFLFIKLLLSRVSLLFLMRILSLFLILILIRLFRKFKIWIFLLDFWFIFILLHRFLFFTHSIDSDRFVIMREDTYDRFLTRFSNFTIIPIILFPPILSQTISLILLFFLRNAYNPAKLINELKRVELIDDLWVFQNVIILIWTVTDILQFKVKIFVKIAFCIWLFC